MTSINEFDYILPKELIAYEPCRRGESRLLILNRKKKTFEESVTREIPSILEYPAVIARNTTRVVKTRFFAFKESGGRIEFLVLNPYEKGDKYNALIKRSSKLRIDDVLKIGGNSFVKLTGKKENIWNIKIESDLAMKEFFERYGHTPLPPYIKRSDLRSDEESYQTVYADTDGSSAAPTA
ncbi:TPA: tRNA preQ1(34) S-adenosylmethionine ribosyltransferase-isomerase QueA, partial [candidate division WOR-3 bacterium]|nr:tRNA preQ1(34) S-adenosylmethionine ribosyltransferase-isomerase QueA [candidate division WOR-3 bacterium]